MAAPAVQYSSEQFVESAGAVLFDFSSSPRKVCLVHYLAKNEWLLAKGRRNCNESRQEAALREVREEAGYAASLHPVTMASRAPSAQETEQLPDQARSYANTTEPFMLTIRQLNGKENVKFIWWYIAEREPNSTRESHNGEVAFEAKFFPFEEATQKLTFEPDREVLKEAITVVETS